MSSANTLWSAQQFTSLHSLAPHSTICRRHCRPQVPFISCRADSQQDHRSTFQSQSLSDSRSAQDSVQSSRREAVLSLILALQLPALLPSGAAHALGFQKELKKKRTSLDEYSTSETGIKYYDLRVGGGDAVVKGNLVTVHFDCMYKSLDVVSSRSARLLGANRSIAEPVEFTAGLDVGSGGVKQPAGEGAGGLFSGASGPKPPPALSQAVLGMKPGGKRSVIVPPELGYGKQGLLEIPPDATFELQVQLLSVK
ncbi:TPA: hypothetical protein ACH3X2_013718 [Trebouxia sp. C0005]|nr:MAG: peptidyl-prolyl cis-trans FKBP-type [Trebouxia sp. A1-2]